MVADAFTKQMDDEGHKIRSSKEALEKAIAEGGDLAESTTGLDKVNDAYKKASANIRKHTSVPKTKKTA